MPDEQARAGDVVLCFGCRALADAPISASDKFPADRDDSGKWERFTCERCGLEDVRRTNG